MRPLREGASDNGTMTTAERKQAFCDALAELCREHGAEIEAWCTDNQLADPYIEVVMVQLWNGDRLEREHCSFTFDTADENGIK